jgi:hypothetical protein
MRRHGRWIWIILAILLCATAAAALPHFAIEFLAPHTARTSRATLDEPLKRAVDAELESASPATVAQVLVYSLSVIEAR